jgi:Raf kinase inhibitor-like YbhB/YbcL family protein
MELGMADRYAQPHRSFVLESPAFADGGWIPPIHSQNGLNLSPPLRWHGEPKQTGSFALLLEDPDAPGGTWIHWVLFNIPAALHSLPMGLERQPQLANGARHGRCWGVHRFERIGYQGPQPPPGPSHRYRFGLHALRQPLGLVPGCSAADLKRAMAGQLLAQAQLTGRFATPPGTAQQNPPAAVAAAPVPDPRH